ncbi:MAG: hypothetical protein JSR45_05900 [Proteobacteria bacterium]|nr:hypothetical protein [Pseudomonadota bacterium]
MIARLTAVFVAASLSLPHVALAAPPPAPQLRVMPPQPLKAAPPPSHEGIDDDGLLSVFEEGEKGEEWRAYERVFPKEIHAIFVDIAHRARTEGYTHALVVDLEQRVNALYAENVGYAPLASDEAMRAFARSQLAHYERMRAESVEHCAYSVQHAGLPADPRSPAADQWRTSQRVALLNMIQSGRDTPLERGKLTAEDVREVTVDMARHGGDPRAIDALVRGTLFSLPPAAQCDTMLALMRSLSTMQSGVPGRYLASILPLTKTLNRTGEMTGKSITQLAESMSDFGPALRRLHTAYPQDVEAAGDAVARGLQKGDGSGITAFGDLLVGLIRKHPDVVGAAPDESLAANARAEAVVLRAMHAASPEACGRLISGEPPQATMQLTPELLGAVAPWANNASDLLTYDPARRVQREPAGAADWEMLFAAAKRTPEGRTALTLWTAPESMPMATRCAHAAFLFERLADLPAPVRSRLTVAILGVLPQGALPVPRISLFGPKR